MHNEPIQHFNGHSYDFFLVIPFALLIIMYVYAALLTNRQNKGWPLHRTLSWVLGVVCIAAVVVGPLANRIHIDFTAHMLGHLLLGMVAPLLVVLSAPMTLLLRNMNVKQARKLTNLLKSMPIRVLSNPITASVLNLGGLWILYTTDLFTAMHHNVVFYLIIHIHVFLAGYVFTASMIYIDLTPHRYSYIYRTIILILSSGFHAILSKYIYANPPLGVPIVQAEKGAMLMYYGGDAVEIFLIIILCLQWYRSSKPKALVKVSSY